MDYKKFHNLEAYLFKEVNSSFHKKGFLTLEEFFYIVIWKANRSKGRIKSKLRKLGKDIDDTIKIMSGEIFRKSTGKERLMYLMTNCGFRLPMASAILTVLYTNEFTVYDVRVCNMLNNFHNLQNKTKFDKIWEGYKEFKEAVTNAVPDEISLRDKDRYLWGKSFCEDLKKFLDK